MSQNYFAHSSTLKSTVKIFYRKKRVRIQGGNWVIPPNIIGSLLILKGEKT